MQGGNSVWVSDLTLANIDKIYDFLERKTKEAQKSGKRNPEYSYYQIHTNTGVYRMGVRYACWLLAFKENPIVQIRPRKFQEKCSERVHLIREVGEEKNKQGDRK